MYGIGCDSVMWCNRGTMIQNVTFEMGYMFSVLACGPPTYAHPQSDHIFFEFSLFAGFVLSLPTHARGFDHSAPALFLCLSAFVVHLPWAATTISRLPLFHVTASFSRWSLLPMEYSERTQQYLKTQLSVTNSPDSAISAVRATNGVPYQQAADQTRNT
jgi:hypothetical protein